MLRVVWTGRVCGLMGQGSKTDTERDGDVDMTDEPLKVKKEQEDFAIAEWQTMSLGWRDFQTDLHHAAVCGVRVWRMKVCVVTTYN